MGSVKTEEYKRYVFTGKGFGEAWEIAETETDAVELYEAEVNYMAEDERYDANYSGVEYKPDYNVKELTEEELEEVEILEPCGGLWTNSATDVLRERLEQGDKLPFILCEKPEEG